LVWPLQGSLSIDSCSRGSQRRRLAWSANAVRGERHLSGRPRSGRR